MKSFYKSAIVLILLYSLFSMAALADEKGSEFFNFIQSQFNNLPGSSLGTNTSSSDSNFVIEIGTLHDVAPGSIVDVPVTLYSPGYDMWGFDFLFSYDPSALSLNSVVEGPEFYSDSGCRWEYFEYRYGPNMNCGNFPCPSGLIRVVGLADLSPPQEHPLCLNPGKEATVLSF